MKKWGYMLVDFRNRIVKSINGEEVDDYQPARYGVIFNSFKPAQGTYITDFLDEVGQEGWEAISVIFGGGLTSIDSILFKHELEEEKKGD